MSSPLTSQNGVMAPMRMAPYKGSPNAAAAQQTAATSAKLNKLNNVVHGGADPMKVSVIQPLYKDTFTGPQSISGQQVGNAMTMNQASVQAQGDSVKLVTSKGGRKRSYKKRKSYHRRRSNKHKKSQKRRLRKCKYI